MIPTTEDEVVSAVAEAVAAKEPILVQGNGTKSGMLRSVQAARTLSTAGLDGVSLYAPKELIISAKAGTTLATVEQTLAEAGQHLIAEPPDLTALLGTNGTPQTLGGIVATNLSGPRRVAWGAMRDHVMGIRAVTGRAEVIHSGGRVLKNVTGLDLCKLYTGSHGTLGIITEVTLKVLPAPAATGTLVLPGLDATKAVAALSDALGSPYSVSGAAWLPPTATSRIDSLGSQGQSAALIRIEEFEPSVAYRLGRLRDQFDLPGARILDTETSRAVWKSVRDAQPLTVHDAIWRVSVRPSAGPGILAAAQEADISGFLDWGGGLVWLSGPATPAAHAAIEAAISAAGGVWTLMRAPDALRQSVRVVPDEAPVLANITRQVKAALDPAGIFNPGRLYSGL
jgi:glycolate oxidase FAD binding subunit